MFQSADSTPSRLIRLPEALHVTGLRKSRWYELIAKGIAPAPVKLGRSSLWPSESIAEFVERVKRGELEA
jgi:predicted DNA-binding transcriptional regulator AlpA